MTYIVSSGALNSTHSLIHLFLRILVKFWGVGCSERGSLDVILDLGSLSAFAGARSG